MAGDIDIRAVYVILVVDIPPENVAAALLNEWHPDADPEEVPLYAIACIAKEIKDGNSITFDQL